MHVPPIIYNVIVHPRIITNRYITPRVEKFLSEDKQVLDFGCGTGNNAFIFDPSRYLGVDIDQKRIDFANRLYAEHSFLCIDDGVLPIESKSIDMIFICAVLHHISDQDIAAHMGEFDRILKQDGLILVFEPCLFQGSRMNNWIMTTFDDGQYIRKEGDYLRLFDKRFKTRVHDRFKTINCYNALFFSAERNR